MKTSNLKNITNRILVWLGIATLVTAFSVPPLMASGQNLEVTNSQASWGLKTSFNNYVVNPGISKGQIQVSGSVQNQAPDNFLWTGGKGTIDPQTHNVNIQFAGSVHWMAHPMQNAWAIDMVMSNLRVQISGTQGKIFADIRSRKFKSMTEIGSDWLTLPQVPVANIANVQMSPNGQGSYQFTSQNVTLSNQGSPAFGGFWEAGQAINPFKIVVTTPTPQNQQATTSNNSSSQNSATGEKNPTTTPQNLNNSPNPQSDPTKPSNPATTNNNNSTTAPTPNNSKLSEYGGQMLWAVREGFRSYIMGPFAHGSWKLTKVSDTGQEFKFVGQGVYNDVTKEANFVFPGSIEFKGHSGAIDLTISQPVIHVADGKGTIVADIKTKDTNGKFLTLTGINLVTVDVSKAKITDKTYEITDAPTKITPEGVKAFSGNYKANQEMAPLSVKLTANTHPTPIENITTVQTNRNIWVEGPITLVVLAAFIGGIIWTIKVMRRSRKTMKKFSQVD